MHCSDRFKTAVLMDNTVVEYKMQTPALADIEIGQKLVGQFASLCVIAPHNAHACNRAKLPSSSMS
jgi:hypothetical protein